MAEAQLTLPVDLFADGEAFFDLLKAVIREWQSAPWPHERERAAFAVRLYRRGLETYREFLEAARERAEQGYNVVHDRRLVSEMEQNLSYWEKKLDELTN